MSAAYLDAAVFVHALGRDDDLREACRSVLAMMRAETIVAQSSVLTVEEVVHVRNRRLGDRSRAVQEGRDVASMVALQEVGRADLDRALELFGGHPALDPRDAVHAAIATRIGAPAIISTDADFDALRDVRRIDPRDARALAELVG